MTNIDITPSGLNRWRWPIVLLLALYGLLVVFAGFDRISASVPVAERVVPAPFRANADIAAARIALIGQDPGRAAAYARKALQSAPINSAAPTVLGTALLLNKDYPNADAAFRVAAAGGWRDTVTQLYWAEQSVYAGQWDLAAARVDAVLRAKPAMTDADRIRSLLENDAQGRGALAEKLAARPAWLLPYVNVEGSVATDTLLHRASIVHEVAKKSGALGCDTILPLARALRERSLLDLAETTWREHCPDSTGLSPRPDGNFDFSRIATNDPFGWTLSTDGDVLIDLPRRTGDPIVVENMGGATRLIATRSVRVPDGARTLRWIAEEGDGSRSRRVLVSADCGAPVLPSSGTSPTDSRSLTALSCPVATIGVWLKAGTGPVRIESVGFAPER